MHKEHRDGRERWILTQPKWTAGDEALYVHPGQEELI
eukprot:gene2393-5827_t